MKKLIFIFISLLILLLPVKLHAFDFMFLARNPEIAENNTIFVDIGIPISFIDPKFNFLPLDIRLDYMLPVSLPFSAGLFLATPNPNFKNFGIRLGYHIDTKVPKTDLYFLYSFNLGFIRNDILSDYNDTPVSVNFFDFRIGVRRFFGLMGVCLETGHKFENIYFLFSIKIN